MLVLHTREWTCAEIYIQIHTQITIISCEFSGGGKVNKSSTTWNMIACIYTGIRDARENTEFF